MAAITSHDYDVVYYGTGGRGEISFPLRDLIDNCHFYTIKVRGEDIRTILNERDNARAWARYYKRKYDRSMSKRLSVPKGEAR